MSLFLVVYGLSEVLLVVVSICDGLVAAGYLYMILSEESNVLTETSGVAVDSSLDILNFLVHKTKVQVGR